MSRGGGRAPGAGLEAGASAARWRAGAAADEDDVGVVEEAVPDGVDAGSELMA